MAEDGGGRGVSKAAVKTRATGLSGLRNVGPATLADFRLLGIDSVAQLATHEADAL